MLRQCLKDALHTLYRTTAYRCRLFFSRAFPASLQQFIERIDRYTIVCTPIVSNGCPRNLKQPFLYTLWATLGINSTHGFYKYLRRQVLGLFPVSNFTIDIAVDQAKVFLVKRLKLLQIRANVFFAGAKHGPP